MYTGMTRYVLHECYKSNPFPVLRGTRQEGVSSPLCYIVYVDQLLWDLEASGTGCVINEINVCCPTVADDMVLVSFTKSGLSSMLDLCYQYSRKWRYDYNPASEDYITKDRTWNIGPNVIDECEHYTHLGINLNRSLSLKPCVQEACRKLRATFFILINCGVDRHGLNPLSSKSLYKSIVIPRALYGSALWNDLSQSDLSVVEFAHGFCIKYMQYLGVRTKTRLVYHLLDMKSIERELDRSKLVFLGQLCNIPDDKSATS